MLPSLQLLKKVSQEIRSVPNRRKESKRGVHYGLFLLGYKSGLRINEAISFDLGNKTKKGLYRIEKTKGKKERLVYVPKEIIRELKKQDWKPNQTNRWNFYHFLRKIKRELSLPVNIELTPHTLRRAFATYHAESGLPLPLLQKLLGHSSIRTTALYWRDIYGKDEPSDILTGKKWLEEKEPPKTPINGNFSEPLPKKPDSEIVRDKSVIAGKKSDNSPPNAETEKTPAITNYQPKAEISGISPKNQEKFSLTPPIKTSEQLPVINEKEKFLLTKIKQLEEQLVQVQAEKNHLKLENKHLKVLIRQDQRTESKVIQSFT